jgi:ubiquinone/menaquinone biosynthesis C-methylase UbiE
MQKTDVTKVAEVYDDFARQYKLDCRANMPDGYLVDLEVRTLLRHIKNGGKLLDVGCGNGYTAIKLAQKRNIEIVGVDVSTEMIKYANQFRGEGKFKGTVEFRIGDILAPDFVDSFGQNSFDTVLTKRTLINILSWEEQKDSIIKISQLLKPRGTYIIMEATVQGYENMNRLRESFGIPRTSIRWHNVYLDERILVPFLNEHFDIVRISNFASTYYIGSRVVQPLLLKPFGKEPRYEFWLNRCFARLPSFGDYGIQKLFICGKKEK